MWVQNIPGNSAEDTGIVSLKLEGLSRVNTSSARSRRQTYPGITHNTMYDVPHSHQNIPLPSLSLRPPTHGRSLACFPSNPSQFSEFLSAQIYCIKTVLQVWELLLCKVQAEESSYWEERRRGSVRVFGCRVFAG